MIETTREVTTQQTAPTKQTSTHFYPLSFPAHKSTTVSIISHMAKTQIESLPLDYVEEISNLTIVVAASTNPKQISHNFV